MVFIYDCNGQRVGNPNGYKTMGAANGQYNRRKSKVRAAINAAYDARWEWYELTQCPVYFRRRNWCEIKTID